MHIFRDSNSKRGSSRAVLALPGILATGQNQINPVREVLEECGDVFTYSYHPSLFNGGAVTNEFTQELVALLRRYREVVIVGVSLGGIIAALACDYIDQRLRGRVKLVLVDAPYGAATMIPLPLWAHGIMRKLRIGRWANPLLNGVLKAMAVPPKPENTELEPGVTQEEVNQKAIQGLSGHNFSLWWQQLRWMVQVQPRLDRLNLRGIKAIYLACNPERNTTVRQPQAVDAWMSVVPALDVRWVDSTHCGFLERRLRWLGAFQNALSS